MGSQIENSTLRRPRALGIVLPLLIRHLVNEHASRHRATGKRSAGLVIGTLPEGWHVVRDLPVGDRGAHIDHVVVGPAGTFTLNAKDLTGKVWVGARSVRHNGHPTNFLSKAACDAHHVSEFLSSVVGRPIEVRGVLAILADEWTIDEEPAAVHVGSPRGVKDWMLRLPVSLSPHQIHEITAAAGTSSTRSSRAFTRQG
jgi:Nuclease-related domain